MTPRELEDRLIVFSVSIIQLSDGIKPSIGGRNLAEQITSQVKLLISNR
jgi:hypothetical protein